jgi:hypothetical protein
MMFPHEPEARHRRQSPREGVLFSGIVWFAGVAITSTVLIVWIWNA